MWGSQNQAGRLKPWSTPALRDAIKQRNTLRQTVQSNRVEYPAACGEVRRLSEEARRAKWEEFLAAKLWMCEGGRHGEFQETLGNLQHGY